MRIDANQQASLGSAIRSALDSNSFRGVKLLCLDHNFDLVEEAISTFNANPNTFDGGQFSWFISISEQNPSKRTDESQSFLFSPVLGFQELFMLTMVLLIEWPTFEKLPRTTATYM